MSSDDFPHGPHDAGASATGGPAALSSPYDGSASVRRRPVLSPPSAPEGSAVGTPVGVSPVAPSSAGAGTRTEPPALPAAIPPRRTVGDAGLDPSGGPALSGGAAPGPSAPAPDAADPTGVVSMSAATPAESGGSSSTDSAPHQAPGDLGRSLATEPQAAPAPGPALARPGLSRLSSASSPATGEAVHAEKPTQALASPARSLPGPDYDAGPSRRRLPTWLVVASFVLFLAVGAGAFAYAAHYDDRVVPGTSVAGTDLSGMSRDEVVTAVKERSADATVSVSGDATATASLEELGFTIDAEATADAVMARGDGLVDRFRALVTSQDVDVVTTSDKEVLAAYAMSLIPDDQAKAVNATVVLSEDEMTFTTTPSSAGTSLDPHSLEQAAQQAAASLSPASASVAFGTSDPVVSDSDAEQVASQANSWVAQDISVSTADGSYVYTADAVDKASWITVANSSDAQPTITVDPTKVKQWVEEQASDASSEPVNGVRNVNSSGKVVSTPTEAVDGQSVNNADTVAEGIVKAVSSGQVYSGSFEMTTVKATWTERTIADGAENLIYQAAPGEKWIDVNLANYTVTAYEGATVVHGPVTIVDGATETPTVTGTYKIYLQYSSQTMEGDNVDGSRYRTEDVPWVSYFHGGYAFHGAPWRSDFGYSASHGCVNMPVSDAKWIYDWVEVGETTVVSHR